MMSKSIALIAVDQTVYHFDKPFTYYIPESLVEKAKEGCRVLIPFGNGNKKRQGMILQCAMLGEQETVKGLKSVFAVLDAAPLLNQEMLSLAQWVSKTTFCTLFEAIKLMLPVGINIRIISSYLPTAESMDELRRQALPTEATYILKLWETQAKPLSQQKIIDCLGAAFSPKALEYLVQNNLLKQQDSAVQKVADVSVKMVRLTDLSDSDNLVTLTAKQKLVVDLLRDVGTASVKEICYFLGVTNVVILAVVKKGIAEFYDQEVYRNPYAAAEKEPEAPDVVLTEEQQIAYRRLLNQYESGGGVSLLYGVTGSGKTSVFLKLIHEVVERKKNVIVMVPEISLTPQLLETFHQNFGKDVAVFHSGLSMGERMDEWKRVKKQEAHIVVGTRSAVFAPMDKIGLIVMDEEQEYTYKSDACPRFHARDVARFRCAYHHALLLLSSATPSIESFYAADKGKYSLNRLTSRYGEALLPDVEVVDMNAEVRNGNRTSFSSRLLEALEDNLQQGHQSILLLNRRGYHTFLSCKACGTVVSCPHCSISLTYHAANHRLMCHYCGYSVPMTEECPQCHQKQVKFSGFGTQKAEEELAELFPCARILRMDTDTTLAKFSHEERLKDFALGKYDIMIGTQMVAKGLDFENVTLVGVISADQALYSDDFRSYERAFSLLTQVVGRSGRGNNKGKAIIQTMTPENPIIRLASRQDYDAFYQDEIAIRKARLYPPFADLCVVGFVGEKEPKVVNAARYFLAQLTTLAKEKYSELPLRVIGPTQAAVYRVSNKYRYKLLIKCKNGKLFREMLSGLLVDFGKERSMSDVTAYADMNPDCIL